jgi:hypothetical protein
VSVTTLLGLFLNLILRASGLSDQDALRFNISLADKFDLLEEILTELSVYFGMLYHMIEVFKGHEDFAEELSQCLLVSLLALVAHIMSSSEP